MDNEKFGSRPDDTELDELKHLPFTETAPTEWSNLPNGWNSFDDVRELYLGRREIIFNHPLGRVYAVTSVGGPRSKYRTNEDGAFCWGNEDRLIAGVFDGAGGSEHGRIAAKLAIAELLSSFQRGQGVRSALNNAHDFVIDILKGNGYGTVAIVEITKDTPPKNDFVNIVTLGDSGVVSTRDREYFPEGSTQSQNLAQEDVDAGVIKPSEYYSHQNLNVITGGLGISETSFNPHVSRFERQPDDVYTAFTDGIGDVMSPSEIARYGRLNWGEGGRQGGQWLYEEAMRRNNSGPNKTFVIRLSHDKSTSKLLKRGDNLSFVMIQPPI